MSIQGPHWLVVIAGMLVACGSSSSPAPEPAPAPEPEPAAPVWQMPDVLGVNALADENPDPNIVEVTLAAGRYAASYVAGKKAQAFAYNGSLPGPLLKTKVGDKVIVHFKNNLAEQTTIHWHGLRISDQMDGSPRVQHPVEPGAEFTYEFTVPDAGSYWYHPHINTAEQVEKGLYAPIVVFDPAKDPTYDAERFLVLDDIRLAADGTIAPESPMDGMMSGRFGNMLLTNGRPVKEAVASVEQGTVERWRIVNSANARTMQIGVEGASFRVIATDGGLLPEPYTTKKLSVAIGQRYDLEVTYDQPGTAKLSSYVESADSKGNPITTTMSAFTVDVAASDRVPREIAWPSVTLPDRAADGKATMILDATQTGDMPWTINGKADSMDPLFTWSQGATLDITIVNKVATEHPFHLHGQFFEILDAKQPGLKDVVLVPPSGTVQIRAFIDNPGHWMAHCHILEHAEMGMMGEIYVTPDANAPPMAPMSH
jgi:FtsP/CotA-like multicopper oxidase with cupredoxin domain